MIGADVFSLVVIFQVYSGLVSDVFSCGGDFPGVFWSVIGADVFSLVVTFQVYSGLCSCV